MLFRLALKNLTRNKRRTVLSTLAIVVGTLFSIWGKGLVGGIEEGIIKSAEDGLTGHVQIRAADYPRYGLSHPVDVLPSLSPEARAAVEERAEAVTERVMFVGTLAAGVDSLRVRVIGFDPATDEKVFRRTTWQVAGTTPASKAGGLLIGNGVANLLDLDVGDRVILQARTHQGAWNALDMEIGGILSSANSALDLGTVLMTRDLADELVRAPGPTHVVMRLADRERAEEVATELAPALGAAAETWTWKEETGELLRMQQLRRRALDYIVALLLLISGFAIANSILMAAHERVREIGTLRAMGMSSRQVLGLFLIEGGLMGAAAGLLGVILGSAATLYQAENPIDLADMAGQALGPNIQFSTYLYAQFSWDIAAAPFAVAVLAALGASFFPAKQAAAMLPADAVRAD